MQQDDSETLATVHAFLAEVLANRAQGRDRPIEDGLAALVSCLERVRAEPLDVLLDSVVADMYNPASPTM